VYFIDPLVNGNDNMPIGLLLYLPTFKRLLDRKLILRY